MADLIGERGEDQQAHEIQRGEAGNGQNHQDRRDQEKIASYGGLFIEKADDDDDRAEGYPERDAGKEIELHADMICLNRTAFLRRTKFLARVFRGSRPDALR
jgi:hypothetical protein